MTRPSSRRGEMLHQPPGVGWQHTKAANAHEQASLGPLVIERHYG